MNSDTSMTFHLHQPFLKSWVLDYRESKPDQDIAILTYEFQTENTDEKQQGFPYIPTGCIELLFIQSQNGCMLEIVGTTLQLKRLSLCPYAHYFGVRLRPGIMMDFRGLSLKHLVEQEYYINSDQDSLLPVFFKQLRKASSLAEKNRLFFHYFRDAFLSCTADSLTGYMIHAIHDSNGNLRIHELADTLHYSERHLSRIFLEHMGISPKSFSRIVRFQSAMNAILDSPDISLCRCLFEFGYSDQAHFQREFKQFTGITPKHFAMETLHQRFPMTAQYGAQ